MATQILYQDGSYSRIFQAAELSNVTARLQTDLLSASLPASTLEFTVALEPFSDVSFRRGQRLVAYGNGRYVSDFYITAAIRQTERLYAVSATDKIGVLTASNYPGGVALDSDVLVETAVSNILSGAFPVVYQGDWESTERSLYGLLAPQTRRDALSKVLFAWGQGYIMTGDGQDGLRIFKPPSVSQKTIPRSRIKVGASLEYGEPVTGVEVKTYDFDVEEKGSIKIGNVFYKQSEFVSVKKTISENADGTENVKTSSGATVYVAFGDSPVDFDVYAAHAMADYYKRTDTVKVSFPWGGERLGDCITVYTRLGSAVCQIQKMTLHLSGICMADVEGRVLNFEQKGLFSPRTNNMISGGFLTSFSSNGGAS